MALSKANEWNRMLIRLRKNEAHPMEVVTAVVDRMEDFFFARLPDHLSVLFLEEMDQVRGMVSKQLELERSSMDSLVEAFDHHDAELDEARTASLCSQCSSRSEKARSESEASTEAGSLPKSSSLKSTSRRNGTQREIKAASKVPATKTAAAASSLKADDSCPVDLFLNSLLRSASKATSKVIQTQATVAIAPRRTGTASKTKPVVAISSRRSSAPSEIEAVYQVQATKPVAVIETRRCSAPSEMETANRVSEGAMPSGRVTAEAYYGRLRATRGGERTAPTYARIPLVPSEIETNPTVSEAKPAAAIYSRRSSAPSETEADYKVPATKPVAAIASCRSSAPSEIKARCEKARAKTVLSNSRLTLRRTKKAQIADLLLAPPESIAIEVSETNLTAAKRFCRLNVRIEKEFAYGVIMSGATSSTFSRRYSAPSEMETKCKVTQTKPATADTCNRRCSAPSGMETAYKVAETTKVAPVPSTRRYSPLSDSRVKCNVPASRPTAALPTRHSARTQVAPVVAVAPAPSSPRKEKTAVRTSASKKLSSATTTGRARNAAAAKPVVTLLPSPIIDEFFCDGFGSTRDGNQFENHFLAQLNKPIPQGYSAPSWRKAKQPVLGYTEDVQRLALRGSPAFF